VSTPLDEMASGLLDALVERIAERAAEIVLQRLDEREQPPHPPADDRLLDVKEVAARLSVPASAVYKLADAGKLASVKVGGRLRFRASEVERFIERGTRSDERVRELARTAQADAMQAGRRTPAATASKRRGIPPRSAPRGGVRATRPANEQVLKVLTKESPDRANTRRSR